MGVTVWLRPPRHLMALFAVVTLVPVVVLLWLGWKVLEQDRDLEGPRARQRLEGTATRVADALSHQIHETIDALPSWVESPPASITTDAALIELNATGVSRARGAVLPFVPLTPKTTEPGPEVWDAGESLENRGDFKAATDIFNRLSTSSVPSVRTGALLRLAGDLRRLGQFDRALAAYRLLAAADGRLADEPAELHGRAGACEMLAALGRTAELQRDAAAIGADLVRGRWTIDRGTFEFRLNQVRQWTTVPQTGIELPLAAAIDAMWPDITRGATPQSGARNVWQDDRGMLVIWRKAAGSVAVLAASPDWIGREWRSLWSAESVDVILTDGDRVVIGRQTGAGQPSESRASTDSHLPWTIRASIAVSDAEIAASRWRRWLIGAGLGVLLLLIPAGGYLVARAMQKELAVARLQADFVSAVSHEFRTPLTAMSHLVDRLQRDPSIPDGRRREYYDALSRDTHRLRRFVESLLDFGRMEAGATAVRLEPVDLPQVVAAVVEEFRADPAAGRHPVALTNPDTALPVRVDRESFGRALWNLLDNAAKYSPADAPIEVRTSVSDHQAIVHVRDQGIGVPAAERQTIFRKFVRGTDQRTSGIRGTGVGLAMVDQIVRAHGGEVRLDSEVGVGSEFSILLPAIADVPSSASTGTAG